MAEEIISRTGAQHGPHWLDLGRHLAIILMKCRPSIIEALKGQPPGSGRIDLLSFERASVEPVASILGYWFRPTVGYNVVIKL